MKHNKRDPHLFMILALLFMLSFANCSKSPELNGNWVVKAIRYKGQYLYPNTIQSNNSLIITIDDQYTEKIVFNDSNKLVKVPGIDSHELTLWYKVKNDSIEFLKIHPNDYNQAEYSKAKNLYLKKYKINYFEREGIVELTKDNTIIQIISEELLLKQKLDRVFRAIP